MTGGVDRVRWWTALLFADLCWRVCPPAKRDMLAGQRPDARTMASLASGIYVKVEPVTGADVWGALSDASAMAKRLGCYVAMTCNGVDLMISPVESAREAQNRLYAALALDHSWDGQIALERKDGP